MDNHGAVSNNPAVVYVMVKHNPTSAQRPVLTRINNNSHTPFSLLFRIMHFLHLHRQMLVRTYLYDLEAATSPYSWLCVQLWRWGTHRKFCTSVHVRARNLDIFENSYLDLILLIWIQRQITRLRKTSESNIQTRIVKLYLTYPNHRPNSKLLEW